MSIATLSGFNMTSGVVTIPSRGIWVASDVELEQNIPFPVGAAVTLVVAGLVLVGRIYRGEVYPGGSSAAYRIEGGNGGWRKSIQARSFTDDSGVRVSSVLASVVSDMLPTNKEAISFPPTSERILGASWMRDVGPAARSLALLPGWYMQPNGVTFCGPRTPGPVTDIRYETTYDPARRRLTVATETPELWTPGLTLTDPHLARPFLLREVTIVDFSYDAA